jgi:hypothetical protein
MGLGIATLLLLFERRMVSASTAIFLSLVLITGMALTQSRTALIFGLLVLFSLWLAARRSLPVRSHRVVVVALWFAHVSLTLVAPRLQEWALLTGTESLAARGLHSLRWPHYRLLLEAMTQSPWTGYGWLQVGTAELAMAGRHPPIEEFWTFAHNIFLDLTIWSGIPVGVLLSVLIAIWYFNRLVRVNTWPGIVAMLSITTFGVHALLELPHQYAYFLVPIGLWAGIADHESKIAPRVPWLAGVAALAAAAVLLGGVWIEYPEVEQDFRLMRFEQLRVGDLRADKPAPEAPFLSGITAYVAAARVEPGPGMSDHDLAVAKAVASRFPYVLTLYRLARAEVRNGRIPQAQATMRSLRAMHGEPQWKVVADNVRERISSGQVELAPLLENEP